MPNHVMNQITIIGSEHLIPKILESIQCDRDGQHPEYGPGTVDFNKLLPMPERLNLEAGSNTIRAVEAWLTGINPDAPDFGIPKVEKEEFERILQKCNQSRSFMNYRCNLSEEELQACCGTAGKEEVLNVGKTAVQNILDYGASNWYEWCTAPNHWNTKWNAYDFEPYHGDGIIRFCTAWTPPHPIVQAISERFPSVFLYHDWADEDLGFNCGECEYQGGKMLSQYLPMERNEAVAFASHLWSMNEQVDTLEEVRDEWEVSEEENRHE